MGSAEAPHPAGINEIQKTRAKTELLRRLDPDTEQTRTLQFLVEARRKFVNDKTRYSNRLTAYLKMYFPQVLDWFSEVTSPITGDFLERWPSLQKVQKARPETMRRFFVQHHSCKPESIDRRLEEIRRGDALHRAINDRRRQIAQASQARFPLRPVVDQIQIQQHQHARTGIAISSRWPYTCKGCTGILSWWGPDEGRTL